jgi:hypothetical protein
MNTSYKLRVLYILCGFIILIFWFVLSTGNHVGRTSGQISNEVYVWQRQWDSTVSDALAKASNEMAGFAVLAAEVSFKQGQIEQVIRVPVNYEELKATKKPIILALRIGPYGGVFSKNSEITHFLGILAGSLIEDARENSIEPAELQIDYDCAESKLSDYLEMVKILRRTVSSVPILITALPSWLKHHAFESLVKEADGFVLQVHSLERPKNPDAPIILCDIASTYKWVEKAAMFGVPFRVALPTYGYIVGFDGNGKFLGISAEGPVATWPDGAILRVVDSDAAAISELVQTWQLDRPANMQGLIWYRMPIKTDQRNWNWETLSLVMSGHKPREEIKVEVDYSQTGLAKISLVNSGQITYHLNSDIKIDCDPAKLIAADGLNGFVFENNSPTNVNLKLLKEKNLLTIYPGEQVPVGWLRFNGEAEIKAYVNTIQ